MTTADNHDEMTIFVPLTKFDPFTGAFEAVLAEERLDKSNEIMDYGLSKPEFQAWSDMFKAATAHLGPEGQSAGNLRAMHQPISAGKFTAIDFDDTTMQVVVKGNIVDPVEKEKAAKGVYTGLSLGGRYKKRWDDPVHKGATRYIASPAEGSLVDNPCMYGATFKMLKQDGSFELHKFLTAEERAAELAKAAPEKPQDTPLAAQKWVATDNSIHDTKKLAETHSTKIAADAEAAKLSAPARAALDSVSKADDEKGDGVDYADPGYQDDKKKRYPVDNEKHIRAAWSYINKPANQKAYSSDQVDKIKAKITAAWKKTIDKDGPPSAKKSMFADMTKGAYTFGTIARIICDLEYLKDDLAYEAFREGDDGNAPVTVGDIATQLITFLAAYAAEEASERQADTDFEGEGGEADVIVLALAANAPMQKCVPDGKMKDAVNRVVAKMADPEAKFTVELGKAIATLEPLLAKAKVGHSKQLQMIHDMTAGFGADCSAEKAAPAAADKLAKAEALVTSLQGEVTKLSESVPALVERLNALEAQPAAAKGAVRAVNKNNGTGGTEPAADPATVYKNYLDGLPSQERAHELMKVALSNPVSVIPNG